ncbi:PEP-CTERM sorting domain-containing protein [Rugamonas sp.]|uniref:PEP-CTERM sorting domain-containing protein n=1 Tax=Rugamonas sp. TaxID=1926287 RepID=UPI0025F62385|nr:PEP-CTERM sorting domain-containing protein [Rugamonas sp.]
MKFSSLSLLFATGMVLAASASAAQSTVTFSDGLTDNWVGRYSGLTGPGGLGLGTYVDSTLGDDAPSLRTTYNDHLKIGIRYYSDAATYTGDYTKASSVTVGFDIDTLLMTRGAPTGSPQLVNDLYVDLLDHNDPTETVDASILSYKIGAVSQGTGWTHFSVTFDPRAALGDGWSSNSTLSAAQILSNVDELAFRIDGGPKSGSTIAYDVAIDNISFNSIAAVPEPGSGVMMLGGLGLLGTVLGLRRRAARQA